MEAGDCLFADYLALAEGANLTLDHPHAWAGAIWRIGGRAWRLHLSGRSTFTAEEARVEGLCDEVGDEPSMAHRSALAADAAAELIARRGGDALERAEFARLFAAGEPQEGLAAFLEKRRPRFGPK